MDLGLAGRRYLLTGASRGLGLATARHLVADGADVLLVARDGGRVTRAARELAERGPGGAHGMAGDLADPDLPARVRSRVEDVLGGLDGAVLSVGGPPPGRTGQITDEQWRAAFEQVHLGPLRLARTLLLEADGPLAVTFVLSTSVRTPIAGLAVSNALRPGLAMAAKTMADEFGADGHRVNVVLPGRIDTDRVRELDAAGGNPDAARAAASERIPLGRYGRPEEFGAVAALVTSPAASYVSGSVVTVDGGMTRAL